MAAEFDKDEEMREFEKRYGLGGNGNSGDAGNDNDGGNGGKMKPLAIVLAVVALVLAGILVYIWVSKQKLVDDLNVEKDELTAELVSLQNDYENLSSNNSALNDSLAVEKEKVGQLIERLQKTESTNRSKIRQYERELGTLRSIMKSYIKQIDSLNTLNTELRHDLSAARKEAAEHKQKNEALESKNKKLEQKAQAGAVLKASGFSFVAVNSKNKEMDRRTRVAKMRADMNLVENAIAERGWRTIYIRVISPEGNLLGGSQQCSFTCNGVEMTASASREVDYQGEELPVSVYYTPSAGYNFTKGKYTVEVYTEEAALGTAQLMLK